MELAISGGNSVEVSETVFGRDFSEALVHQVRHGLPGRRAVGHQGAEESCRCFRRWPQAVEAEGYR